MEFKKQLCQLKDLLQQDSRIEVTQFEIGQEASNAEWENLQKRGTSIHGIPFPQPAGSILRNINGYYLEWVVRSRDLLIPYEKDFPEEVSGRICIYDPPHLIGMYVFDEWKDTLMHHAESDNPDEPLDLMPFDYYHPDYSGCACFAVEHGFISQQITFHSSQFGFYEAPLNLEEYLAFLIASGGMLGSREGLFLSEGIERAKLLHYIPQILPQSIIQKVVSAYDAKNQ
jgi:hypothetical protein